MESGQITGQSAEHSAAQFYQYYQDLKTEIEKTIIGQNDLVDLIITAIFTGNHVICTGVPGLGKTLLINTIGKCLGLDFKRIQFTPDLMPSDITGFEVLEEDPVSSKRQIKVIKGPLFSQIVLADEVNRTSPKTQSALLQAMSEREVTIGNQTFALPSPFFVFATQNPIEQEGTYNLPEAQLDRFMFHLNVAYTDFKDEVLMVKQTLNDQHLPVKLILKSEQLVEIKNFLNLVPITDTLVLKAVELVSKTRPESDLATAATKKFVRFGAGPRAAQFLVKAARCHALIHRKALPDFEDLKQVALPILDHRIIFNYEALSEGITKSSFVRELLDTI